MLNVKVALPGVHMAGSDAHYNAHIEVGQHGFALFLAPDAECPSWTSRHVGAVKCRGAWPPSRSRVPVCLERGHKPGGADEAATCGSNNRTVNGTLRQKPA